MGARVIIADDLTGAGDAGVHFAAAGMDTALLLNHAALADAVSRHDAVALSSETRFLAPVDAARRAGNVAAAVLECGGDIAFKKIDSTLRGNPGAEIEAILDIGGFQAALVCPTMPKTGRTCRDGVLLLDGVPLDQTGIAADPVNPVRSARIDHILAAHSGLPAAMLPLAEVRSGRDGLRAAVIDHMAAGARVLIADAVDDDDMRALGRVIRDLRPALLPAGAGGLAEAVVGQAHPDAEAWPCERMLLVLGSLTAETAAQIDLARASGQFAVLEVDIRAALADIDTEVARLVTAARAESKHLLLKNGAPPAAGERLEPAVAEAAAAIFAKAAKALSQAGDCGLLYASGGSTAVAVAARLGLDSVTLRGELAPGVVLSSCRPVDGPVRWFVTKAGGFGAPDVLVTLADRCGRKLV